MDEYPAQEEGEEGTSSQTIAMDQEVSHSQSGTPDQLEHEVIVIVTDTESEHEQEEGEEDEEEQVEHVDCIKKIMHKLGKGAYTSTIIQFDLGLC